MATRRQFLKLAAGGALGLGAAGRVMAAPGAGGGAGRRLLILGGTGFLGPHLVRQALARGHDVTLFNRGRTNTHLFPEVEKLKGDRDGDLEALKGRTWDAVIDNTGYDPRLVRDSARLLKGSAGLYLFTSTRQVYAESVGVHGVTEDAPLKQLIVSGPQADARQYGARKALCEAEVRDAFPGGAIVVRPGLIAGPGDRSGRFTYWLARVEKGGQVLAPGAPDDPVQLIDVRDITGWFLTLVEGGITGTFTAAGPAARLSVAEFLYGLRAIFANEVAFTWVPADFLAGHGVGERKLAPWLPPASLGGMMVRIDNSRARAAGLSFRPLAVTARDTIDWFNSATDEQRFRSSRLGGLVAGQEAELLAAWHASQT